MVFGMTSIHRETSVRTGGVPPKARFAGWHPCVSAPPVEIAPELLKVVTVPDGAGAGKAASRILFARAFDYGWAGAGPLSVKCVLRGVARYAIGPARFEVGTEECLLVNEGQHYEVEADDPAGVEMLVVFLGPGIVADALRFLRGGAIRLLDEPWSEDGASVGFFERLLALEPGLSAPINRLAGAGRCGPPDLLAIDEALRELALHLIREQSGAVEASRRLSAIRPAAREELYRRLLRARDFARSSCREPLRLEDLARAACLSPSHLVRNFRQAFGVTPHRFIRECRLQTALKMLRTSDVAVTEVCFSAGFESLGSFSSLFRRRFGVPPSRARKGQFEEAHWNGPLV
jgi:AraC-like DNA-binding protein